MSSYAPIWNHGYDQRLLIYGITAKGHLNIRHCDLNNKSKMTDPTKTATLPDGNIVVPSAIVGLHFDYLTRVYGIIKKTDEKGTSNNFVYMLSPVPEDMPDDDIITTGTSLAGMVRPNAEDADDAWLYYLNLDGKKTKVFELDLQGKNSPKPLETLELLEHTTLAAFIGVNGRRFVAYQISTGFIEIYELDKGPLPQVSHTNKTAKKMTPLALAHFEKGGAAVMNVYYLGDGTNEVVRSQRIGDGDWVDKTLTIGTASQSSTLSATWNEHSKSVYLSFKKDKGDLVCVKDKF